MNVIWTLFIVVFFFVFWLISIPVFFIANWMRRVDSWMSAYFDELFGNW